MEVKRNFRGSKYSCHLFLRCSRILGFLLPALIPLWHFHSQPHISAWPAGMELFHLMDSPLLVAVKSLTGPSYLGWNYHSSLHVFPSSPFSLHFPLAPVHSARCSHALYEEENSWYESYRFPLPAHSNQFSIAAPVLESVSQWGYLIPLMPDLCLSTFFVL